MNKLTFVILVLAFICCKLNAQVLYVDVVNGKPEAKGTIADPLNSLEKAINISNSFKGDEPVTIKIFPGLYILNDVSVIKTAKKVDDTLAYTIEAVIMPDDTSWHPLKMPIIQSLSKDNSTSQFPHCVGFLVQKNNVTIRGVKFIGNANPAVAYYLSNNKGG